MQQKGAVLSGTAPEATLSGCKVFRQGCVSGLAPARGETEAEKPGAEQGERGGLWH